jgi:hypothetical protein
MPLPGGKDRQKPVPWRTPRVHHAGCSPTAFRSTMMKMLRSCITLCALAALATGAAAAGKVNLKWVEPDRFSDIGFSARDRELALQTLAEHFDHLARRLPDGQTLKIDVTDLNLAGEVRMRPQGDIRVLKNRADWPTMELSYTLEAEGRAVKSGQVRLSDMGYGFSQRTDSLGYEKRMIDRWFKTEFEANP